MPAEDDNIPMATPIAEEWETADDYMVDPAIALAYPEFAGRTLSRDEKFFLSGRTLAMGSSNVADIWYTWQTKTLHVRFLDGSVYRYEPVPLDVVVDFGNAMSPGRFVWNTIRTQWPTSTQPDQPSNPQGRGSLVVKGTRKGRRKPQVIRLRVK